MANRESYKVPINKQHFFRCLKWHGFTEAKIAEAIGVSSKTIQRAVTTGKIDPYYLEQMASIMHEDPNYISGIEEVRHSNKLERNPVSSIEYMIQNLCCIYNGGAYYKEENGELLEKTIDMLNELYRVLGCFWDDKDKIPEIINIIAKYNAMDGSEMMKKSQEAWLKR